MIINERGTLTFKSEVSSGTSKKGNSWQRQTIVVEATDKGFKHSVSIDAMNEKVEDLKSIKVGDEVDVKYTIDAREWQGRWFNDVRLYSVGIAAKANEEPVESAAPMFDEGESLDPQDGDLPF